MVFAYKCVLAVCGHNHPTMIKIHSQFFFFQKKKSQLSSHFDFPCPRLLTDCLVLEYFYDHLLCTQAAVATTMYPKQCRCFVVRSKSEHKSHYYFLTSKPLSLRSGLVLLLMVMHHQIHKKTEERSGVSSNSLSFKETCSETAHCEQSCFWQCKKGAVLDDFWGILTKIMRQTFQEDHRITLTCGKWASYVPFKSIL